MPEMDGIEASKRIIKTMRKSTVNSIAIRKFSMVDNQNLLSPVKRERLSSRSFIKSKTEKDLKY